MNTKCFTKKIRFQDLGQRELEADFLAGYITSDAGGLVLQEIEAQRGLIQKFSNCFTDNRNSSYVEHNLKAMLSV